MATSPLQSTEWAVEDVGNGINTTDNKVPTTLPHKRLGWGFPEPPGRSHLNYWMNAMHLWKEYFKTTLEEGGLLTQNFNILTEESDYSTLSIVVGAGIVLLDRDTSDQTFKQSVKTSLSITPSVTAYISIRSDTGVVAETSDLDGGGAYDLIPLYRVTSNATDITQVIDLRSPLNSNANAIKDLEDAVSNLEDGTGLAPDSIDSSHLQADSVGTSEMQTGAVTANEIAANTITASELAPGSVGSSEILADSVTGDKIPDNTIDLDSIKDVVSGTTMVVSSAYHLDEADRVTTAAIFGDVRTCSNDGTYQVKQKIKSLGDWGVFTAYMQIVKNGTPIVTRSLDLNPPNNENTWTQDFSFVKGDEVHAQFYYSSNQAGGSDSEFTFQITGSEALAWGEERLL